MEFSYLFKRVPVSWKRARRNGNRYFDSQKGEKEEYILEARKKGLPTQPLRGPLWCFYIFTVPMPTSWSKKKKKEKEGSYADGCAKDCSNLVKFIEDAFNGVLYGDDKQITFSMEMKVWGREGSTFWVVGGLDENEMSFWP